MKKLSIDRLKGLTKEVGAQGGIVFFFNRKQFQYTSYGKDRLDCKSMQALADKIMGQIKSGDLDVWSD